MYSVDGNDEVIPLSDLPPSATGAPLPALVATEDQTFLVYCVQQTPGGQEGSTPQSVSRSDGGRSVAVVAFENCVARMLGPPNDEAFVGHPLYEKGLRPHGVFEVRNSSWLRALERMNSVHPRHVADLFHGYRHFIFAFQDSTFECIAKSYGHDTRAGSAIDQIKSIAKLLEA